MLGSEEVEQDHESEEDHVEKEWKKVKLSLQKCSKRVTTQRKQRRRKEGG